jgi:hypothetical protein
MTDRQENFATPSQTHAMPISETKVSKKET